jgi:mannose-1-phosphate guanylyltransferase
LANSHILHRDKDAVITVTPADHIIADETLFARTMDAAITYAAEHDVLMTLGILPTHPSASYGYIQAKRTEGSEGTDAPMKVKTFTEKPNLELAKVFFESGEFFWNSGIFLWNLQAIDNAFHELLPDIAARFDGGKDVYGTDKEDSFISEIYPSCENISIDYGVLEKASNVNVLCSDFGWSDLGTWGSLFDISPKDHGNNVTMRGIVEYYDAKDNVVAVPKNKLAVIQGLEDYIVAENDDVLLICRKADEQKIRQFVNDVSVKFNGKYI